MTSVDVMYSAILELYHVKIESLFTTREVCETIKASFYVLGSRLAPAACVRQHCKVMEGKVGGANEMQQINSSCAAAKRRSHWLDKHLPCCDLKSIWQHCGCCAHVLFQMLIRARRP